MINPCISLDHANRMTDIVFVDTFGDVVENAPWIAEYALGIRPFLNRDAMITAFSDGLFQAREDAQLDLIRAQSGCGSGNLRPKDQNWFNDLVMDYKETFGFPFILALTDVGKDRVIKHFNERMTNSRDEEFKMALGQIAEIFRLRIENRICPDGNDVSTASENNARFDSGRAPPDHRVLNQEHSS